MKLYNANIDKIETIKPNDIVEIDGSNMYIVRLTEAQRNSVGLYDIIYQSAPNRRYYTITQTKSLVGNKYIVGYTQVEKHLDVVKISMYKDFFEKADTKEDVMTVVTTLGITVKGNSPALQAFTLGAKRGATSIRDENYQKHTITVPQMNILLGEIEDNAMTFFDLKGNKFDEIQLLPDVTACILYEATPYDYTITQEDVDNDIDGTLSVGDIIIKHKNNVKEW